MENEGVEPKLKPKESVLNYCGGVWQEEKLCMSLLLKLIFSTWGCDFLSS